MLLAVVSSGCRKDAPVPSGPPGNVVIMDIDGNSYRTVLTGGRHWMVENLRASRFADGDPIMQVQDASAWIGLSEAAWAWANDSSALDTVFGKWYNHFAVSDPRGLCPSGWHVPTDIEWQALADANGGVDSAGAALKSTGTVQDGSGLWNEPNTGATNASGFSGLPAGGRSPNDAGFYSRGNAAMLWSSTITAVDTASARLLTHVGIAFEPRDLAMRYGLCVRCIRD
jgi:uncharacterized protein (TIGR02145 family)